MLGGSDGLQIQLDEALKGREEEREASKASQAELEACQTKLGETLETLKGALTKLEGTEAQLGEAQEKLEQNKEEMQQRVKRILDLEDEVKQSKETAAKQNGVEEQLKNVSEERDILKTEIQALNKHLAAQASMQCFSRKRRF